MRTALVIAALSMASCAQRQATATQPPAASQPRAPTEPSYTKPKLAEPGCLMAQLQKRPGHIEYPERLTIFFVITRDGTIRRLRPVTPVSDEVLEVLGQALSACEWVPGRDPQGRPTSIPVMLPLRLVNDDAMKARPGEPVPAASTSE